MPSSEWLDANRALRRYEEIRPRLPFAQFPAASREVENLTDLNREIDVFVLDGYGVLNVGGAPVLGAPERIAALRKAGKRVIVLTNGATYPPQHTVERYRRLGFNFDPAEIVSSRDALAVALKTRAGLRWGFAATADSEIGALAQDALLLQDDPADYATADGFALLSSGDWNQRRQELLIAALTTRPRPVLVGNPDLVAPRENGLSAEPGFFAHDIADRTGCTPEFYGKPFRDVFDIVQARIGPGVDPRRIAMVGDTPYTDILGGATMGWRTVLVHRHGLLKDYPRDSLGGLTVIRPDFIADTT